MNTFTAAVRITARRSFLATGRFAARRPREGRESVRGSAGRRGGFIANSRTTFGRIRRLAVRGLCITMIIIVLKRKSIGDEFQRNIHDTIVRTFTISKPINVLCCSRILPSRRTNSPLLQSRKRQIPILIGPEFQVAGIRRESM
jgi:hypothetical protein